MKYLVVSDIHGNLEALKTVLAREKGYDRLLCLGDLVGYGASPNEVLGTLRRSRLAGVIRGNHDKVCTGIENGDNFNNNAYQSAVWTRDRLTPKHLTYLQKLPQGPRQIDKLITIAHGSPLDEDFYIIYENDAVMSFQFFSTPLCFFGHTHVPGLFVMESEPPVFYYLIPKDYTEVSLDFSGATRYLINPGSVGQPRDYDARASYCVLDTEKRLLTFHKVAYPVEETVRKIGEAGLPAFLGERLLTGV